MQPHRTLFIVAPDSMPNIVAFNATPARSVGLAGLLGDPSGARCK